MFIRKPKNDQLHSDHCSIKTSKNINKTESTDSNINEQLNTEKSSSRNSNFELNKSNSCNSNNNNNAEYHKSILDIFRSSDPDFISFKENKKRTSIYCDSHKLANEIFKKFIDDNAKYEINIPDKIRKDIKTNLIIHNQNYNSEGYSIMNEEKLDIENIFDAAYEIVIQDLYLNAYTDFISTRNRKNKNKNNHNNFISYDEVKKNKEKINNNNCDNIIIDNTSIISNNINNMEFLNILDDSNINNMDSNMDKINNKTNDIDD